MQVSSEQLALGSHRYRRRGVSPTGTTGSAESGDMTQVSVDTGGGHNGKTGTGSSHDTAIVRLGDLSGQEIPPPPSVDGRGSVLSRLSRQAPSITGSVASLQ